MLDDMQRLEAHRHLQRGLLLERAGRLNEAVEEFRQAIAHNPHLREAHDALAAYYQRHGLLAKAAEELRIVAALEEDAVAYYNLGATLADLAAYDAARAALRRCLELDPQDHAALLELAYVDYAAERFVDALESLTALLPKAGNNWEALNLTGLCLLRLGHFEEALASLRHALAAASEGETREEVLSNLARLRRHTEFHKLRNLKDRLYAEEGSICLGSAQDDGLAINEYQDYTFSEGDIATSADRFLALASALKLPLTAVVALDRAAQPLARVLAEGLGLVLATPAELTADDIVLLVGGVAQEAELLDTAAECLPCASLAFCLAITWLNHPTISPPQIIGVVARRASLPWGAQLTTLLQTGAPRQAVEQLLEQSTSRLRDALAGLPPEPLRGRQIRYYTRYHRQIELI